MRGGAVQERDARWREMGNEGRGEEGGGNKRKGWKDKTKQSAVLHLNDPCSMLIRPFFLLVVSVALYVSVFVVVFLMFANTFRVVWCSLVSFVICS